MQTDQFLSRLVCPVIPVIVLDRVDHAVPLAEALFSGLLGIFDASENVNHTHDKHLLERFNFTGFKSLTGWSV